MQEAPKPKRLCSAVGIQYFPATDPFCVRLSRFQCGRFLVNGTTASIEVTSFTPTI